MNRDDAFLHSLHWQLLPFRSRVLAAVSGGADSIALLCALHAINEQQEAGWSLRVLHVNHGIRGAEAQRDATYVLELCRKFGLAAQVVQVDTLTVATHMRISVETAARDLRYKALIETLNDWPGDYIVTGHTLDDQAETVILRLLRGSGLRGLGAMAEHQGRIVRPLLRVTKSQVFDFLSRNDIAYCEDSSNSDPRFTRNVVRRKVIPVLQTVQPATSHVFARTASSLRTDYDFIKSVLEPVTCMVSLRTGPGWATFDAAGWRALHPSLRRHFMQHAYEIVAGVHSELNQHHLEDACDWLFNHRRQGRMSGHLPGRIHVSLRDDICTLTVAPERSRPMSPFSLTVPGSCDVSGGRVSAELLPACEWSRIERALTVCGPLHALCDGEALSDQTMQIRSWAPGDRISPLGLAGSKKIQDLFVDRRVQRNARDFFPVFVDSDPFWIPGITLDRRVSLTTQTRTVMHIRFEPTPYNPVVEFLGQIDPDI